VRLAIVERFGTLVADRREALRFLIDQGVVTPQAAREDV